MQHDGDASLSLEGLVHDLNNILETISEAADLLSQDPKWRKLSGTIHRNVERGRRIVGGFWESARSSDLDASVDSALEFVRDFLETVRRPKVQFTRRIEPGMRVPGPQADWERVLMNLLVNAAQAMDSGGAVEIEARRVDDHVRITVSDNGPGIPPENLSRIFKPHFSTKAARGRLPVAGLGLHIVESLVKRHGGEVTASNLPSAGAAFEISVPCP